MTCKDLRTFTEIHSVCRWFDEIKDQWAVLGAGDCELALHRAGKAFRASGAKLSRVNNNAKLVLAVRGDFNTVLKKLTAHGVAMGEGKSYAGTGPLCDGTNLEGDVFQVAHIQ